MYFCTVNGNSKVMMCTLSSAHWQQASKLSSPCGALSRFEKIEINAPINTIKYNTIQYNNTRSYWGKPSHIAICITTCVSRGLALMCCVGRGRGVGGWGLSCGSVWCPGGVFDLCGVLAGDHLDILRSGYPPRALSGAPETPNSTGPRLGSFQSIHAHNPTTETTAGLNARHPGYT